MEGTSRSYFPTAETTFSTILECVKELVKMQQCIVKTEKKEVLSIRSTVLFRIQLLFKEIEADDEITDKKTKKRRMVDNTPQDCGQNPHPTSHLPSSVMEEPESSYFPPALIASSTISECIKELLMMQHGILKSEKYLSQGESPDKEKQEVLESKEKVVCLIQMLFKETNESSERAMEVDDNDETEAIDPSHRPLSAMEKMLFKKTNESSERAMEVDDNDEAEAMDPSHPLLSATERKIYSLFASTEAITVIECILDLFKMKHALSLHKSPEELKQINRTRSYVIHRIQMLFNGTCQNRSPKMEVPSSSYSSTSVVNSISKCIRKLRKMLLVIFQMVEYFYSDESLGNKHGDIQHWDMREIRSSVVAQLNMLFQETNEEADDEANDEAILAAGESMEFLPCRASDLVEAILTVGQFKAEEFSWSSNGRKEETKGRYLCVSNGFEIWCLDLKHSQNNKSKGPVTLPRIASLNLLERKLPASVGLFNLGTEAYIIGGQMLSDPVEGNLQGIWLYKRRCYLKGVKGSSRDIYRLSLDADKDVSSLSYSDAGSIIEELKTPKVWPIVEKIEGQLHVMDSIPLFLRASRDPFFSHEVCSIAEGGGGWKEIPTIQRKEEEQIRSHVVVGNRMYAVTSEGYLEFDSSTEEWKGGELFTDMESVDGPYTVKRVCDILSLGFARCVGEIPRPHGEGERLFVLFALLKHYRHNMFAAFCTSAVAYVVTLTGRVVCYQPLPDFFEEVAFQPCHMIAGTMIQVDPDKAGTVCSVVSGTILPDNKIRDYLFINTFSVDVLVDAGYKVEQLLKEKASEVAEIKFVRIVSNDRSVYHTDAELKKSEDYMSGRFVGWRACFVNPS